MICTCAALAALLLCPLPARADPAWDVGMILGYAAIAFAVVLYLYPLRGSGADGASLPHRRLLTVSQHRRFGWIALTLGAIHTVLLLVAQPLSAHYLLPSAPLYMLCGLGALIALGILVPTGLSTRTSMRKPGGAPVAAPTHAILASIFMVLLGAHLLGSGQYVDTRPKAAVACLLLAMPLLWNAIRTWSGSGSRRYWAATITALVAGFALLLLPMGTTTAHLMEPATRTPDILPMHFPHELHTSVNCVACHHNFQDDTGKANCIDCHRSARADLTRSSEATFHVFCRDCHRELALAGEHHGPTRECAPCHH